MTANLLRSLGRRVAHVTARSNLDLIRKHGLCTPTRLAELAGIDAETLVLRRDRRQVVLPDGVAQLNHQRPIVQHLSAARAMLDGHSPQSWAAALDTRVFLWPEKRGARFAASIARDADIATLWFDTAGLLDLYADLLDLSPINSGNFAQGGAHARRGDWIYVPVSRGLPAFAENRRSRGLVKSRDGVTEMSLRGSITPKDLNALLQDIT